MKPTLAVLPTEKAYPVKMEKPYEKPVSKCSENRRSTKPIMEKRRRARINNSLSELKNLILDALKKDNARHSKLEKADILEMTVKHLQNLQRQQLSPDPQVLAKFRAGFTECASEVNRFMGQMDGADPAVRQRLLHHLAGCLTGMNTPPASPLPPVHVQVGEGGVQLVPTRLPSGDIAFLLPASAVYAPATVPISPASSTSSSAMSVSSASPGPVSVLGSSGILSPAASDRCSPNPVLSGRVQDYHHHLQGPAASHHLQGPVASHHLQSPVASHHLQSPVASHHLPSPVASHHLPSPVASHHRSHSPVPHRQSPLVSHIPVIMHHKQSEQKTVWRPF